VSHDLSIVNGHVWTGDPAQPRAEAVAMRDGRIAVVGTTAEVRRAVPAAEAIDARGGLIVPGFIDAHLHLLAGGFRLTSVQLRGVTSRDAFVSTLRAFAASRPPGTWITGGDWDHETWGGELPSRAWIDEATTDHPVWLTRLDSHMALANTPALRLAGLSAETPDVAGGAIVRDAAGAPTGLLKDNAMRLVERVVPPPSPAEEDAALAAAMDYVSAQGVTSVHHMGSLPPGGTWHELDVFRRARDRGALRVRIHSTVPLDTWPRLAATIASGDFGGADGRGDEWLRIGSLKSFVDGSLGARTAAFHEPYADRPDCGLLVNEPARLRAWMIDADAAGLQLTTHAIGDRANTLLLDLLADVAAANGGRDRRFRVEHAQHLRDADVPRFAALGAVVSMQPYHAIDDGRWAERAIGPARARLSYAWRTLAGTGARLAFGSDWFVAPATPLEGLDAAVNRRTLDGRHPGGWIPDQRIDLDTALHAYTTGAAYAVFEEGLKGRLAPGCLADAVVIDRDLFAHPAGEIGRAAIAATIVGGTVVYRASR
jgi:predicted amidohydrolase YtcJ